MNSHTPRNSQVLGSQGSQGTQSSNSSSTCDQTSSLTSPSLIVNPSKQKRLDLGVTLGRYGVRDDVR